MLDELTDELAVLSNHAFSVRALGPITVSNCERIFVFGMAELKFVVIKLLVEVHDF